MNYPVLNRNGILKREVGEERDYILIVSVSLKYSLNDFFKQNIYFIFIIKKIS